MITIVEPKQHIDKLWGKQRIREDATFRLMRYVLRVDHEGKVLLHNVVTGQLAVLEQVEAEMLERLPAKYEPVMDKLVAEHYLVPEEYDEHQQVVNLRMILNRLDDEQESKDIIHYTILSTTACNARCYYCFEHSSMTMTMSAETADNVVKFIDRNCGKNKMVSLTWFGGEPTLAADRITQICKGLRDAGIRYDSQMISNGFLLDEYLIDQAVKEWHLQTIQITIDGTEKTYNKIKSYVGISGSAYNRVMNNIGLLLEKGIKVTIRMNFDLTNISDFKDLAEEVKNRFGDNPLLMFTVHPINGEYADSTGKIIHGDDSWFEEQLVKLQDGIKIIGLKQKSRSLPFLQSKGCLATSDTAVTIIPNGHIVRCPEQYGADQYRGSVTEGIKDNAITNTWRKTADYPKCRACVFFPDCNRIENCSAKDRCQFSRLRYEQYSESIKLAYSRHLFI